SRLLHTARSSAAQSARTKLTARKNFMLSCWITDAADYWLTPRKGKCCIAFGAAHAFISALCIATSVDTHTTPPTPDRLAASSRHICAAASLSIFLMRRHCAEHAPAFVQ